MYRPENPPNPLSASMLGLFASGWFKTGPDQYNHDTMLVSCRCIFLYYDTADGVGQGQANSKGYGVMQA